MPVIIDNGNAPPLETQVEGSESQNNVSANSNIPPASNTTSQKLPLQPAKGSPGILAEDLGGGKKYGAMIYIQNRFDGNITAKTTNFYLQQMALGLRERSQVLETFGVANVSFFGQAAKVYNFGGTALDWSSQGSNSWQFFHASSLVQMYNDALRGSELVKNNQIAVLRILNHTVYGYPLQLNVQYDQGMDKMATFSMAFLVTKHLLVLPGVVSASQLESLYSATKTVPLNDAAATAMDNLQTIITACSTSLNVDSGSDFYGAQNVNNSLLHKNTEQLIALLDEGGSMEANFTALMTSLQSFLATADGQISPFIAQVFGPTEDSITNWFSELFNLLDSAKYKPGAEAPSPEDAIQMYRERLGIIKNFMDSLQSNLMAIQG